MFRTEKAYVEISVPQLNVWVRIAVTAAVVTGATALRMYIGSALPGTQFITFFPGVMLVTYLAGAATGLFAIGLSTLSAWFFVMSPMLSFRLQNPEETYSLLAFCVVATLDVALVSALRSAVVRVRDLNTLMFTTFDAQPDGVVIIDNDQNVVDCNRRAQAMFGMPPATMAGLQLEALLPDRVRDRHGHRFRTYQADPVPRAMGTNLTLSAQRADGTEFPVDVQIGPIRLRDRTLFMATVRDVTERHAAEAALAESYRQQAALEERARNAEETRLWADAFHNAAFGIAIWDATSDTVQFANPAMAAMLGLTVQQVQGTRILNVYDAEERERVAALIQVADTIGQITYEAAHRRSDGSVFPVQMHVTSVQGADDSVLYRIATAQDITERKLAEAMADEFQAMDIRFRQIFDESPIGMVLATTDDFRFVRVNEAFARMLGYDKRELVGRLRDDVAHPDDKNMPPPQADGASADWHPVDKRYLHADGHIVRARVRVVRLKDGAAQKNLVLGLAEDVTRQREIERALQHAQRMEAIGNLAGGMAHDFNNLLAVIIASLDCIAEMPDVSESVAELVEDAIGAALRGADLTSSLLAFARRQPLRPTPIQLNELIRDLADMVKRLLREDIVVSLALAENLPLVTADRAQLEAAIINLANNARDAMPKGGSLRITTANRILDTDFCNHHPGLQAGGYAVIEVSDTGCGIAPDLLERIFDPFFTTKPANQGTGLGLSMVFGFIRQSGGHVDVSSEPGVGTTVQLYLPQSGQADDVAMTVSTIVPEPRGDGVTVLVAEDNVALRRIVVGQLTGLGYQVAEADDGIAALATLAQRPFDLLFSDVVMPRGINGFELAERAKDRQPGLKVVLTSGFPQWQDIAPASIPADAPFVLRKPYRRQELAQALQAALCR